MSASSSGIQLQALTKTFGPIHAVDNIDLHLPANRFVCLLGPSGCGKTSLLRLIAGLESPDSGTISFEGSDMTAIAPHKREIGMVFQSLALFPHLNIADNIGYALKIRGEPRDAIEKRVTELLDLVRLPGVGKRAISQLSGGQRQRIAIARALAIRPKLFLLDEPLSALDAKLREAMQVELRQLQKNLGITTIVVTHDQREAMTMADHVVVMKSGKILQHGAPLDIYRNPANAFVADFIGTSNLITCRVKDAGTVEANGSTFTIEEIPTTLSEGDEAVLSVRPEEVLFADPNKSENTLEATITFIRDLGSQVEIMLESAGQELMVTMSPKDRPDVGQGDLVRLHLPAAASKVIPK
ncbi:MAG: ABC transporter ATP-binding protein [Pseudomonadota bacterium]